MKLKNVAVAVVALALAAGMTACGGSASSTAASSTSEAVSSSVAASSEAASSEVETESASSEAASRARLLFPKLHPARLLLHCRLSLNTHTGCLKSCKKPLHRKTSAEAFSCSVVFI